MTKTASSPASSVRFRLSLAPLLYYLKEREAIRLRRLAQEPWPWTRDRVLQNYRFTNVKRMHDKTTMKLMEQYKSALMRMSSNSTVDWYGRACALLLNCGIYRWFGTWEFALAAEWATKLDGAWLVQLARTRSKQGLPVFTSAYVITNGGIPGSKAKVVVNYLRAFERAVPELVTTMERDHSWRAGYTLLRNVPGFGGSGFMSKEVLQDYVQARDYIAELKAHPLTDAGSWTPVGPGARRGLNRLYCRPLNWRQPESTFTDEVQRIWLKVDLKWAQWYPTAQSLTAHDVQFALCEVDKYMRAQEGGRPKRLYRPPTPNDAPHTRNGIEIA